MCSSRSCVHPKPQWLLCVARARHLCQVQEKCPSDTVRSWTSGRDCSRFPLESGVLCTFPQRCFRGSRTSLWHNTVCLRSCRHPRDFLPPLAWSLCSMWTVSRKCRHFNSILESFHGKSSATIKERPGLPRTRLAQHMLGVHVF